MLSNRQRAFVTEYVIDFNATQAAVRAGYSVATAKQQGSRLLAHSKVKVAVSEALARRAADAGVKADEILRELKVIAFSEPSEKYRAGDKLKALELLGRHLKMFTDKVETSEAPTLGDLVPGLDRKWTDAPLVAEPPARTAPEAPAAVAEVPGTAAAVAPAGGARELMPDGTYRRPGAPAASAARPVVLHDEPPMSIEPSEWEN